MTQCTAYLHCPITELMGLGTLDKLGTGFLKQLCCC